MLKYFSVRLFFVCLCLSMSASALWAQKFGYVDSEYILRKMPVYQVAMSKIDSLAQRWEADINTKFAAVTELEDQLSRELVLLTEEMIEDRKYQIKKQKEEAESYKEKIFGYEGLFFLKERELLEPLQDELYVALEKICTQEGIQLLLDKAHPGILYTNPIHDYTEYVLEALGLSEKKSITEK